MVNNGYQWLVGGLEHEWIMTHPSNPIDIPINSHEYSHYIIPLIVCLVLWNMTGLLFHSVGNFSIIPTDDNSMIFQRGRVQPPSRCDHLLGGLEHDWIMTFPPNWE